MILYCFRMYFTYFLGTITSCRKGSPTDNVAAGFSIESSKVGFNG